MCLKRLRGEVSARVQDRNSVAVSKAGSVHRSRGTFRLSVPGSCLGVCESWGNPSVRQMPTYHGFPASRRCLVRLSSKLRRHKGLKKLYADDVPRGVPPDTVDKLRKMLAFLDEMEDPEELRALPSWKVHTLTGGRNLTWGLSVTANRRLTLRVDTDEGEIYGVNLADYH
jgi:toxin HigB-1